MTTTTLQIQNFSKEEFQQFILSTLEQYMPAGQKPKDENYKTRKETAELLRITLPTLNQWSRLGIIQSCRVGSRVLYRMSDIDACIKNSMHLKYKRDR